MSNLFYTETGQPQLLSHGNTSSIRNEFILIRQAFDKLPTPTQVLASTANYGADTGGANAYVVNPTPVQTSYTAGMEVVFKALNTCTGSSTINVNGIGVVPLVRTDNSSTLSNDIVAGQIISARYDGVSSFQITQNTIGNAVSLAATLASANAAAAAATAASSAASTAASNATTAANNASAAATSAAAALSTKVTKAGDTMSGALNAAPQVTIASAGTVAIGAAAANSIVISGVTTITAFDSIPAGALRRVRFTGALTLTHNVTTLILPGAANITTTAGDSAVFESLGSGNWICISYNKAAGHVFSTWTVSEVSGKLYFSVGGVNKMSLDSSGNLITLANITAFGTP